MENKYIRIGRKVLGKRMRLVKGAKPTSHSSYSKAAATNTVMPQEQSSGKDYRI